MNSKRPLIIASITVLIFFGGFFLYSIIKPSQNSDNKKLEEAGNKIGSGSEIVVPGNLTQCTSELVAQSCDNIMEETVCGYDHSIYTSGAERDNIVQFKSACHYCKFYGLSEKTVAGTKIKALGYETKDCDQGMYKK